MVISLRLHMHVHAVIQVHILLREDIMVYFGRVPHRGDDSCSRPSLTQSERQNEAVEMGSALCKLQAATNR